MMAYTIEVNGLKRTVDVDEDTPLLWVLRDELDLKGSKFGCGVGLCGACTVLLDGEAMRSCLTPISSVGKAAVATIEGMAADPVGKTLQAAWMELDVPQCGYCQAGQIMSAAALLSKNPHPSDHEIDEAMSGNVCRCCAYLRIRAAIKKAARMRK
jgi:isoquinoline 1-oxidoreductase alpha subunit